MTKVITRDSDSSSFLISTIIISWRVNFPVMRPSFLCERAQHLWMDYFGQLTSLRLLTKAILRTQVRSNMEIIKPSM